MRTFKTHKDIDIKPLKRKSHYKLWLLFGIFMITLISLAGYGVKSFFEKYYFISPVQSKDVKVIKITPAPTKAPKKPITVRITEPVYAAEWDSPIKTEVMAYFDVPEQKALETLIFKESGWHPLSVNSSSGSCGLFQALPCSKLPCDLSDIACQAKWGKSYIENRYGNAQTALEHENNFGWY